MSSLGDENIRRFNVAVNNPLSMSGVKRVGHFNADLEHSIQFHRAIPNHVLQGYAVQKLHHNESRPFCSSIS